MTNRPTDTASFSDSSKNERRIFYLEETMHIAQIFFLASRHCFCRQSIKQIHSNIFAKALRFPRTPNFHTFLPLLVYMYPDSYWSWGGQRLDLTMNGDQSNSETDAELTTKQNERVFLRQRFLQFLLKTAFRPEGVPATIVLHEGKKAVCFPFFGTLLCRYL